MNRIFLFFIAVVAVACTSTPKEDVASNIFIEQKLGEFIAQHPEWTSGENANDEITEKFQREVIRWSNEEQFLKDMPLQLKGTRDTLLNTLPFKIGTFTGYNDNTRPVGSLLNFTQLQIDGIIPQELVKDLVTGKNYQVSGSLYKQGKRGDVKVIKVADFKGYDLGKYLFSVTKLEQIK